MLLAFDVVPTLLKQDLEIALYFKGSGPLPRYRDSYQQRPTSLSSVVWRRKVISEKCVTLLWSTLALGFKILTKLSYLNWRIVQSAERLTLDQEVGGSSPPPPALNHLMDLPPRQRRLKYLLAPASTVVSLLACCL